MYKSISRSASNLCRDEPAVAYSKLGHSKSSPSLQTGNKSRCADEDSFLVGGLPSLKPELSTANYLPELLERYLEDLKAEIERQFFTNSAHQDRRFEELLEQISQLPAREGSWSSDRQQPVTRDKSAASALFPLRCGKNNSMVSMEPGTPVKSAETPLDPVSPALAGARSARSEKVPDISVNASVAAKISEMKKVGGSSLFQTNFTKHKSRTIRTSVQHLTTHDVVASVWFEIFCTMLIMVNAVVIGIETEQDATNGDSRIVKVISFILNAWFALELLLRIVAFGPIEWCTSKDDRLWNFFDLLLVFLWVTDLTVGQLRSQSDVNSIFRTMRLLRVLRTLRIFRFARSIKEFRKMIYACTSSISTLMWSLLLLVFELYFFSIIFLQAWHNYSEGDSHSDKLDMYKHFGSMRKSSYSLFMAMSNGVSWGVIMDSLSILSPSWMYESLFLFFIAITVFGILNVLTAVFVESAMTSTQHNRDLLVQEKESLKRMYVNHIKDIFRLIDADHSGVISASEIEVIFSDSQMSRLLEALEIGAYDAHSMFKLLDLDGSGWVDIDEFCDGCLRLKGDAKSFDVQCLMYENQRLLTKTEAFIVRHEVALGEIRSMLRNQLRKSETAMTSVLKNLTELRGISSAKHDDESPKESYACTLGPCSDAALQFERFESIEETLQLRRHFQGKFDGPQCAVPQNVSFGRVII